MKRKLVVITCPKCGREYLPAEIYVPDVFIGKPDIIKRDIDGTIKDFTGTSLDLDELYCCDSCNTSFKITAKVSFETCVDERTDFNSEYETLLKPRFTLKEI